MSKQSTICCIPGIFTTTRCWSPEATPDAFRKGGDRPAAPRSAACKLPNITHCKQQFQSQNFGARIQSFPVLPMASQAVKLYRSAKHTVTAHRQREGGGFIVRRPIGGKLDMVDPFLMLDHMGPAEYGPGEAVGAPDHPHRGFETVTYILQGAFQHKDSSGNFGDLQTGDCQWMTAGSGLIHSEMPSDDIIENGGTVEGFQLWVNLPAAKKWVPPRYQDVRSASIPVVALPSGCGGSVKIVAGEACGKSAVIDTHTPISFLDVRMEPGDSLEQPLPRSFNGFVYVYSGNVEFGAGQRLEEGQVVDLQADAAVVRVAVPHDAPSGGKVLLIAGEPINEPISRYGPFVMNTRAEIEEAFRDYREGRLGTIEGAEERHRKTEAARQAQKKSGAWSKGV